MSDIVRINGRAFSAASVILKLDGFTFEGWKSITYGHKRTRVLVYPQNAAQQPGALTRGKYEPGELKLSMRLESAQLLRERCAAKSLDGKSYGDHVFPSMLQYVDGNKPPVKVEFRSCWIASEDNSEGDSPDPSHEDVVFGFMLMKKNGLTLAASTLR